LPRKGGGGGGGAMRLRVRHPPLPAIRRAAFPWFTCFHCAGLRGNDLQRLGDFFTDSGLRAQVLGGFKLGEEFLDRLKSAGVRVFETLPDAFSASACAARSSGVGVNSTLSALDCQPRTRLMAASSTSSRIPFFSCPFYALTVNRDDIEARRRIRGGAQAPRTRLRG